MSKLDQVTVANWLPARINSVNINKSTYGHVFVIGGSSGLLGAPVLSSHAAMRAGAGLVTLAAPADLENMLVSRLSPIVMTQPLKQNFGGTVSASAVEIAIDLSNQADAVGIGPGLGKGSDVNEFVGVFLSRSSSPLVIDADALSALAADHEKSSELLQRRKFPTVLTPHPKELARLLSVSTEEIQSDRPAAIRRAVEKFGCVVVLKGDRTLINEPKGTIFENSTGNAGMATAGSGDVLTGVIAALLGQGISAFEAAAAGVYIHGLAGDLAVQTIGGMTGLIATDIIENLPRAIAQVQTRNEGTK